MPAIVHIANTPPTSGRQDPLALVLAPTRELAQQIQTVAAQFKSLRSVCLFGGSHKSQQIRDLEYVKPKLIVATPGRLNDLLDCEEISAHNISYLVLDEADRMLDMGFEPQIRRIIERTPKTRQTLMWSATWPRDVQDLAKDFMKEYIQINVGGTELHANHNITQHVHTMHDDDKRAKLVDILKTEVAKGSGRKTLIFAETKYNVDGLSMLLRRQGFNAQGIHGGKTQAARDTTLNGFRTGRIEILVATDVAARGLDVSDISYVINFDYPNTSEDYVHRIGRTGRSNNKGISHTFFTRNDMAQARDLMRVLKEANQEIPEQLISLEQLAIASKAQKKNFKARVGGQRFGGSNSFRPRGGGGGYRGGDDNYQRRPRNNDYGNDSEYGRNSRYGDRDGSDRDRSYY